MKIYRPSKAVLLAAGFGTRLLPLTREVPKPLLPLWGRALLDRALDLLAGFGVREVLINLHHGADAIRAHLAAQPRTDLQVQFSFEPEILGTGGALIRAKSFLPDTEPFWLFNADVAADLDPQPLLDAFAQHQPLAALWLMPYLGPRTVEVQDGRIVHLTSSRAGAPDLLTFTGLHLLTKRILDFLPQQEVFASMTPTYQAALVRGEVVRGVTVADAFWADAGKPMDYVAVHDAVRALHRQGRRGGALFDPVMAQRACPAQEQGKGFVARAENAVVAPSARVEFCVLLPGARIAPHVDVVGAVVGPDTVVERNVTGLVGRAERWLDAAEQAAVRAVGFELAQTTVATDGMRGSQRTFMWLMSGARTAILMRYDPAREENKLFALHARFLKDLGLPVPAVLHDDTEQHLTVVEDVGERDLLNLSKGLDRAALLALYELVLRPVVLLHTKGAQEVRRVGLPRMPDFRPVLYHWEHNYFAEHMLTQRAHVPVAVVALIQAELAGIAKYFENEPQVLVHRDLQSSNIIWRDNRPYLIDFQGMRLGPAAYDLASLLCDPYADLPEEVQMHLLQAYNRASEHAVSVELFWVAAIQRLVQALGAFAKLSARPEQAAFARHIPAALRQLHRALGHQPRLPTLQAWVTEALEQGAW